MKKLGIPLTVEDKNNRKLKAGGDYEIFTFPTSSYNLNENQHVKSADIIHLHWISNFVDYPSFFSKIDKPLFWTLHDMNPFQGGFHYEDDSKRNYIKLGALESELLSIKKNSLKRVENITIASPSKWLFQEAIKSDLLGKFKHHYIPYGLDLKFYKIYDQIVARSILNLPPQKKILLFVSEHLHNKRKGLELLLDALNDLEFHDDVILCAVGSVENINIYPSILRLGRIYDERLMPLLYSAVDALILPSREDNLPNVMLEAIACGTPVIGFPIGGIVDVVKTGITGVLASETTSQALKDAIHQYFTLEFNRKTIRDFAVENFGLEEQASKYLRLYKEIIPQIK